MKNKKIIALASAGAIAILALIGTFAANTVFAAEAGITAAGGKINTELQAFCSEGILNVYKQQMYNDTGCTVILPPGYEASKSGEGMYISERYPLDSSNIYYTVSSGMDESALNNLITTDAYKKEMDKNIKKAYGADAVISDYHYEKMQIDGCPAYKIELACSWQEMQMNQLIYIIAADKIYTITYSQAADDERTEDFIKSADTIQIVFSE